MASVNVTVNMPPEMLAEIDDEKDRLEMSRAQYIRAAVREASSTPFSSADVDLVADDTDAEDSQTGAA